MTADPSAPDVGELHRRLEDLSSREAIRDVLFRYTRGVDRADAEAVKQCYHDDADDIHWDTFSGNAHAFADYICGEVQHAVSVAHEITNPIIDLEGERAFVESRYTSRVVVLLDPAAPDGAWVEHVARGRYLDVFERRRGVWRIAHRRIVRESGEVRTITNQAARTGNPDSWPGLHPSDLVFQGYEVQNLAPPARAGRPGHFGRLRSHPAVPAPAHPGQPG